MLPWATIFPNARIFIFWLIHDFGPEKEFRKNLQKIINSEF